MRLHKYWILIIFAAVSVCAKAQTETVTEVKDSVSTIVDAINADDGSVLVIQSEAMDNIVRKLGADEAKALENATHKGNVGYRIQVFSDNNIRTAKSNAEYRNRLVNTRLPLYRTYMSFEAPYWRVRVGDFFTRDEAEAALKQLRGAFPNFAGDMRVVRSRINPSAAH